MLVFSFGGWLLVFVSLCLSLSVCLLSLSFFFPLPLSLPSLHLQPTAENQALVASTIPRKDFSGFNSGNFTCFRAVFEGADAAELAEVVEVATV